MTHKDTASTKKKVRAIAAEATANRRLARQEVTRRKILEAAARVIGRYGYAGCSVQKITIKARMAHGTFYLYFKSQQQLFDTILPTLGGEMLQSITDAIGQESDPLEIERRGFAANVAYTATHHYMNRVLYEAQLFAPNAYKKWLSGVSDSYVRSFKRSLNRGPFSDASQDQLRMVAMMIVNARTALLFQIDSKTVKQQGFVEGLIATYIKFVSNGLGL